MLFWAFINKILLLGYLVIIIAVVHRTWALADLGSYFFKEGSPLALGPKIGPLVEFWVQLSYSLKSSPCHNQSRYGTWHRTKPPLRFWQLHWGVEFSTS